MKFADLHIHSACSDGTLSPADLVRAAKTNGLAAIAITDHDTFDGIAPALAVANGIEVIPGVELTCHVCQHEVHLLGYYLHNNWRDAAFARVLQFARDVRAKRIVQIVERLNALGLDLTVADVQHCASSASLGRLHVARALLARGFVRNVEEAFARFLRPGKPAHVERHRVTAAEGIHHINSSGGVPVLAHPGLSAITDIDIRDMRDQGLRGIETWHPAHNPAQTRHCQQLAASLGLHPTGGSDAHDAGVGAVRIPYELVEKLK
ncbi:MAG: PHP domain-containing protein [Verrucomicrobia bacterium]|nr:PHP domain-containing protein [Verrucomicrobiota bacterium]